MTARDVLDRFRRETIPPVEAPPRAPVEALPEGPELEAIRRIVSNGRRMGIGPLAIAVALDLVVPLADRTWTAVCCWCLDRIAHDLPDSHVYRISYARGVSLGGCMRCAYYGCDTLVASLEKSV